MLALGNMTTGWLTEGSSQNVRTYSLKLWLWLLLITYGDDHGLQKTCPVPVCLCVLHACSTLRLPIVVFEFPVPKLEFQPYSLRFLFRSGLATAMVAKAMMIIKFLSWHDRLDRRHTSSFSSLHSSTSNRCRYGKPLSARRRGIFAQARVER